MRETAALISGFLFIIIMVLRRASIGTTMLTASVMMGFIAGFGPFKTINTLFVSITEESTAHLLAVVCVICILSYLLQKYGILNKMANSLEELFNNNWFSLMLMPLLVGILSVTGGAVISAPVVDSVGDKLGINSVRKSSINMVFRHVAFLLFPFITEVIMVSRISGIGPYKIIKYNAPLGIVSILTGYFLLIRGSVAIAEKVTVRTDKTTAKKLCTALMFTSPLWTGIAFNLIFRLPFFLALMPSIIITYFLMRKDPDGDDLLCFIKEMGKGINWNMIYSVAGIMCLQGFIRGMPGIAKNIKYLLESGLNIRVLIILSTAVMGLLMGSSTATNGMLLPLFLPLAGDGYSTAYITSLTYASSFLFYFISPVHLCQVFTAEYFGIKLKELYKEYKLYWPVLFLSMIVYYCFLLRS